MSTTKKLAGQVAIITGASRGIGREFALAFAKEGCKVVVAAKSTQGTENLPGSIYSVVEEIVKAGGEAIPVKCDVRSDDDIQKMVDAAINKWGRVDILVNNAGALWWQNVIDTPMKRYDLINTINSRASFACTKAVLPHMIKQKSGHIIVCSPPIDLSVLKGKVAYLISKYGMTMLAQGLAEEVKEYNISVNALWPATIIESQASINFKLMDRKFWRTPAILVDAALELLASPPGQVTGQALIDEDFLKSKGYTNFDKYRCDPATEPLRITTGEWVKRGHVSEVAKL